MSSKKCFYCMGTGAIEVNDDFERTCGNCAGTGAAAPDLLRESDMSNPTLQVGITETGQKLHAINPDTLRAHCGRGVWPAELKEFYWTLEDVTCQKCRAAISPNDMAAIGRTIEMTDCEAAAKMRALADIYVRPDMTTERVLFRFVQAVMYFGVALATFQLLRAAL